MLIVADMLATGAEFLRVQSKAHVSRTILYGRAPDFDRFELSATVGNTTNMQSNDEGFVNYKRTRDYFIDVEDLIDPTTEEFFLPIAGDRIAEPQAVNGDVSTINNVYEVTAPGGDQCWRYADLSNLVIRVHVVFVGTEAVI